MLPTYRRCRCRLRSARCSRIAAVITTTVAASVPSAIIPFTIHPTRAKRWLTSSGSLPSRAPTCRGDGKRSKADEAGADHHEDAGSVLASTAGRSSRICMAMNVG